MQKLKYYINLAYGLISSVKVKTPVYDPLAPSVSGSSSHDGVFEPAAKITLDGKLGYSSGISLVVEISNLNKVKESYTEDSLQIGRSVEEEVWSVLQTEGSFPALVNRLLVIKSESLELSPVENAIGMIETRTAALQNELEEPRSSDGDQLPRLQSLQRILQGSVAVQTALLQVNSGVLSVCTAFLSGEPAARLSLQELQQLIAALLEFMAVCKRAIRLVYKTGGVKKKLLGNITWKDEIIREIKFCD
ncbi:hypothetical protein Peur_053842 [Populus x canadensis]